jgi:hypothetical protein
MAKISRRSHVQAIALIMGGLLCGDAVAQEFKITSPKPTDKGAPRIIVTGAGARDDHKIRIRVFTIDWFDQDCKLTVYADKDKKWNCAPVYLGGKGQHNNHTIEAQLINRSGEPVAVDTVVGIVVPGQ